MAIEKVKFCGIYCKINYIEIGRKFFFLKLCTMRKLSSFICFRANRNALFNQGFYIYVLVCYLVYEDTLRDARNGAPFR